MGYKSPTREDKNQAVAREVGGGLRERRKEVALGRLRTVSLILILGAWGGATKGADPDDAAAAPSTATRQAPPAPPIKYLEAGAKLFNTEQFDMASKYLEAANRYRECSRTDERSMLDAYLKELAGVRQAVNAAPVGRFSGRRRSPAAVAPAVTARRSAAGTPIASPGPVASARRPARPALTPTEAKQKARWLLHEGREQLLRGNYDLAQAKVDEARSLEVTWGLFDDTPDKLQEDIAKVRPTVAAKAPGRRCRPAPRSADRQGEAARGPRDDERPSVPGGRGPRPGGQAVGPLLRPVRRQPRQGRRRGQGTSPPRPDPERSRASSRARASMTSWCRNRDST